MNRRPADRLLITDRQMRLSVCALVLAFCVTLHRVHCSLPVLTPGPPQLQVSVSMDSGSDSSLRTERLRRLPGLCRRLKRRRVTVLCNLEKYCWRGRGHELNRRWSLEARSGQVCVCPRGSRCSRFFVHSL
ncbi:uncharacterized protein LOC141802533 [Halichoeres trimaculatus]|uniref:uncharacterized protein LOC141802533 n=1 Tax=Halichoeres trimaculatus TaxID=147232 RepID=UPI003D9E997B